MFLDALELDSLNEEFGDDTVSGGEESFILVEDNGVFLLLVGDASGEWPGDVGLARFAEHLVALLYVILW